jgi:hypothetical protein
MREKKIVGEYKNQSGKEVNIWKKEKKTRNTIRNEKSKKNTERTKEK